LINTTQIVVEGSASMT